MTERGAEGLTLATYALLIVAAALAFVRYGVGLP